MSGSSSSSVSSWRICTSPRSEYNDNNAESERYVNVMLMKTNGSKLITMHLSWNEDPLKNLVHELEMNLNHTSLNEVLIYSVDDPKLGIEYLVQINDEDTFNAQEVTQSDFNTADYNLMTSLQKCLNEKNVLKRLTFSATDDPNNNDIPELRLTHQDTFIGSLSPMKKKKSLESEIIIDHQGTINLTDSPTLGGRRTQKRSSSKQVVTIYPPPPEKSGIAIRVCDYERLNKDIYLNDIIIDFYIKYLCQEDISYWDNQRIHVFSTQFYTHLDKRGLRNLDKWTKDVNIFEKDFIFIPINQNSHWFLAVICFPNKINVMNQDFSEISTIEEPYILIMDSLSENPKSDVSRNLKMYLSLEYYMKYDIKKDFTSLYVAYPSVPRQPNLTDCGLYVIQYVECFLKRLPSNYCSPMSFNLKNWFEYSTIRSKRKEIANVIRSLIIDFGHDDSFDLPILSFSSQSSDDSPAPSKKSKLSEVLDSEEVLCLALDAEKITGFQDLRLSSIANNTEKFSHSIETKKSTPKLLTKSSSRNFNQMIYEKTPENNNKILDVSIPKISSSSTPKVSTESSTSSNWQIKKEFDRNIYSQSQKKRVKSLVPLSIPKKSMDCSIVSSESSTNPSSPLSFEALKHDWTIPTNISYHQFKLAKEAADST